MARGRADQAEAGEPNVPVRRVLFHEITKDAVQNAIQQARQSTTKRIN